MQRVFLDANVIIDGLVSAWTSSHMVLMLCAKQHHRLVTTPYVITEVENALMRVALRKSPLWASSLIDDYVKFVEIAQPEFVSVESGAPELRQACIIRHLHDMPVLAAAIKAKPDWLLSRNRKHFTDEVAARTNLRIATPDEFIHSLLNP